MPRHGHLVWLVDPNYVMSLVVLRLKFETRDVAIMKELTISVVIQTYFLRNWKEANVCLLILSVLWVTDTYNKDNISPYNKNGIIYEIFTFNNRRQLNSIS